MSTNFPPINVGTGNSRTVGEGDETLRDDWIAPEPDVTPGKQTGHTQPTHGRGDETLEDTWNPTEPGGTAPKPPHQSPLRDGLRETLDPNSPVEEPWGPELSVYPSSFPGF
jgi:hypothetical protein